ncbi:hypothetical protein D3C85_607430 [compost metagenome]
MSFSRKYDKRSLTALVKRVKAINRTEVSTGFFPEDQYGPDNSNLPVAQVAWYNERGLGNMVPSRPFMTKTFSDVEELRFYAAGMESVLTDVLDKGRLTKRKLDALGQFVVSVMQMTIADWTTPANSERWAAIKGKNDPLVFTGKMLQSVKYRVEKSDA